MKLLTVAIPCYNSEEYMLNAINSALVGGDDVEILVIDDGSTKDNTAKIADECEAKYPGIVKAIHQENGGHGEAVNAGIRNATGLYYKVLDSDDWLDKDALIKVIDKIKEFVQEGIKVDMILANYVYEKPSEHKHKAIDYADAFPVDKVFRWSDTKKLKISQNILMHSVIYRTKLLRDCGLELPKHTFYVDNIFVYVPLPHVKTMYYMNENLYRYYIGREDQSVNEKVMISRIDQQIRVNKIMIDEIRIMRIHDKKLRDYMIKYLTMMMTVSSVFLIKEGSRESIDKKKELWHYLKEKDKVVARKVNMQALSGPMHLRGKAGRKLIVWGYSIARKIYGFN
ncbi:glycosyltransferase family 2 protein [Eubacterium xylanophilum]|uniref:glycosyltransferase family 2 protein n=1 Tax=Eubacterium xylanophilum TaxID=39497 RepID=UPI00047B1C67|nr:glycosyltransferase family 2 protein [Eubacterium xylanophilum]